MLDFKLQTDSDNEDILLCDVCMSILRSIGQHRPPVGTYHADDGVATRGQRQQPAGPRTLLSDSFLPTVNVTEIITDKDTRPEEEE